MLWTILGVLVVLWLLGFGFHIGGSARRHRLFGAVHLRSGGLLSDGDAPLVPQGSGCADGWLGLETPGQVLQWGSNLPTTQVMLFRPKTAGSGIVCPGTASADRPVAWLRAV